MKWCIQPLGDYVDKMDWDWWTGINMLLHTNNSEGIWHRGESGKMQTIRSVSSPCVYSKNFLKE